MPIFYVFDNPKILNKMAVRSHLTASDLAALYGQVTNLLDQTVRLEGNTTVGDQEVKYYKFDSLSTATDDGDNVIKPTSVSGAGRYLKMSNNAQIKPDWNATSGTNAEILNQPFIPVLPSGLISMWGNVTPPTNWLICNGSAVSRTTYSSLFGVLGITYGVGDGSTTFNLPDCRQKFPLGVSSAGTGNTLGASGGTIDHTHGSPLTTGTPSATVAATILAGGAASTTHTHSVTIPAANPPFLTFYFIVKT